MAQKRVIHLGVLNIKTQPHSPEEYLRLFKYLFKIKPVAKLHGSDRGTPHSCLKAGFGDELDGLVGTFYKFLEIDQTKPWLDLDKREVILDEEGNPAPQVARNKAPNTKEIEFVFFPKGHRLFFNRKAVSPKVAQHFISTLFSDERIKSKFGLVDVELETSIEAIERILKIPTITKLNIYFSRPNDDDLAETERLLTERIIGQKVRRLEQTLTSDREEGVEPDAETKALMNVAMSNGKVVAEGYSGETKVKESTEEHPFTHIEKYDGMKQTFLAAMFEISSGLLNKFTNQKGD